MASNKRDVFGKLWSFASNVKLGGTGKYIFFNPEWGTNYCQGVNINDGEYIFHIWG